MTRDQVKRPTRLPMSPARLRLAACLALCVAVAAGPAGAEMLLSTYGTATVSHAAGGGRGVAASSRANTPATGLPAIGGTAQVGATLKADVSGIADADGLDDVDFAYQWLADDTAVPDARESAYTLVGADEGKAIKVHVTFTDDGGNEEALTSAATDPVTPANMRPEVVPRLREWEGGAGRFALSAASRVVVSAGDGSRHFSDDFFSVVLDGLTDPGAAGLSGEQQLAARLALVDSVHATAHHTSSRRTLDQVAAKIRDDIGESTGLSLTVVSASASVSPRAGDVVLDVSDASDAGTGAEGYELEIGEWVVVRANSTSGVFYGSRTLLQAFALSGDLTAPRGTARDYPTMGHRLIHLDMSRKYWEMDYLADSFRRMSWVKLNAFKMHFADGEAFRLHDPGEPAWSGTVSAAPTSGTGTDVPAASPQGAPTEVRVVPGDGSLTVHWQPPDASSDRVVRSYRVQIRPLGESAWSPGDYRDSAGSGTAYLTAQDRSHTFAALANGAAHQVRVSADDGFPGLADSRQQHRAGDRKWFYDRDDVRLLEAWVAENHIMIMPGFEFPGHASVINDLYETGFSDGGSDRCDVGGNFKPGYVLDTTSPRAVAHAEALMEHFMPWFSGPYVHIGGEEVHRGLGNCARVVAHIAANVGVTTLGDMLTVFFNGLNALVRGAGRSMVLYNGVEKLNPDTGVAQLAPGVVVMDWDASSYTYYGGTPGSDERYRFIRMPWGTFYLTSSQHNDLHPDEPWLYDQWRVDPPEKYLGAAIGVWLDALFWSQDEYTERLLRRPRAVLADRTWNGTTTPGSVEDFHPRLDAVGEPPGYVGFAERVRSDDGRPSHHYGFEDDTELYPPGHYKDRRHGRVHLLRDEAGKLHASSYQIRSPSVDTTDKLFGASSWAFDDNRHGAGVGGVDIPAPWTLSVWVIRKANRAGAVLMSSRSPAGDYRHIRLQRTGTRVGIDDYDGSGCSFNYSTPLRQWTHLAFVAGSGTVTLYANGEPQDSTCPSMPLPMGAISRHGNLSLRGSLDELKIWDEALSREQVAALGVPEVRVSFDQAAHRVAEGDSVAVTVSLSADPGRSVTVPLVSTRQGGTSDGDYSGIPESVAFNSGDTERVFSFSAHQDAHDDDGESVKLAFGSLPPLVLAGPTDESTISITDDDDPVVTNNPPEFPGGDADRSVAENSPAGTAVGAPVAASDPDDGDTLSYTLAGGAGSFTIDRAGGQIRVGDGAMLNHEVQSSYQVTVTATDRSATSASILVDIAVTDVDEPPEAADDQATVVEDTPETIDVLANDTDPEGEDLTIRVSVPPRNGTAAVGADNTVTYTPDLDYDGIDTFTYRISDGFHSDVATVRVEVVPVNDAPMFGSAVAQRTVPAAAAAGTPVGAPVTADDVDGDTLTYALSGTDAALFDIDRHTAQITVGAALTAAATYRVTVTATDPANATATIEVTITTTGNTGGGGGGAGGAGGGGGGGGGGSGGGGGGSLPPEPVEPPVEEPVEPPEAGRDYFVDDDGLVHEDAINRVAAAGITVGCGDGVFCPSQPVTRAQMATFLMRALELPEAGRDYFVDDDGLVHEDAINRVAAAGITVGCGDGVFCPSQPVTRAQMATFLMRALELPEAGRDYFVDDDGLVHEDAINRVAAAGITVGCGDGVFCPSQPVTRAQMATFLMRALEL